MNDRHGLVFYPWRFANTVSVLGLIILFPGFLFFHFAVAAFSLTLPPVLSGLFGPASGALAALFALTVPLILAFRSHVFSGYALSVAGYIAFCLLWSVAHYLWLEESYVYAAYTQSYQTIIFWVALFFCGYFLPETPNFLRRVFWWSFWLMAGFLALYVRETGELMFYARQAYDVEDVATYQGFARSALIVFLVLLSWSEEITRRLLVAIGGAFVLFVLGSRSEFYAFIATTTAVLFILSMRDRRLFLGSVLCVIGVVALAAIGYENIAASRQFEVLDLSASSSWRSRLALSDIALGQVAENPVLGYFGGHIAEAGGSGRYAHNLLSAWVNYGFVGFLWYFGLAATALLASIRMLVLDSGRDSRWLLVFTINFSCILLILMAKPVFWPVAALGWGVYARALLLSSDLAPASASVSSTSDGRDFFVSRSQGGISAVPPMPVPEERE